MNDQRRDAQGTGLKIIHALTGAWGFLREELRQAAAREYWRPQGLVLHPTARFYRDSPTTLTLNGPVTVAAYAIVALANDRHPQAINSALEFAGSCFIGEHSNIRACGGTILIGAGCLIANGVSIFASNHGIQRGIPIRDQAWQTGKRGVTIEDDVWIGAGAIVLPGAYLERGAVVAAGAVVTGRVSAHSIVAGIPARQISTR